MQLYNSLTKQKEEFTAIKKGHVSVYSCGPTVYNNLHIGNLSSFIYADTLVRLLRFTGAEVTAIMNITDIDDKMIRDSQANYPDLDPQDALTSLADKYTKVFKDDMAKINATSFEYLVATDHINDMQSLIAQLLDEGLAYVEPDGVYFDIKAYEKSGKTYGQLTNIDRTQSQSRIHSDEYEGAGDFSLWKLRKDNEPSWDFDYKGQDLSGRPGWHIECSAMSQVGLGLPFDIHTGGIDLKFPHHENEIAQSTALYDKFANYFFHNEHLLVEGQKMAKSKNNFYTLRDVESKDYSPQTLRLVVLQSHYRSKLDFSWDALQAATERLHRWAGYQDLLWQLTGDSDKTQEAEALEVLDQAAQHLLDDLALPGALSKLEEFFALIEKNGPAQSYRQPIIRTFDMIRDILGIDLTTNDITTDQKKLLDKRQQARADTDWQASDDMRDKLLADHSLMVKDTPNGQLWSHDRTS